MMDFKRVRDVMRQEFIMVDGLTTVQKAIDIAKQKNITTLIVDKRDANDEFGVVLMSDIAKQVLSANRAIERVNLYEIMAKPVLSISPNMNIKYCARFFERFGLSKAPVIDNERVLGIVSYDSIVLDGMVD